MRESLTDLQAFGLNRNTEQLGGTLNSLWHMTKLRNLSLVMPGIMGGDTAGRRNLTQLEHLEWSATIAFNLQGALSDLQGMSNMRYLSVPGAFNGTLSAFAADVWPHIVHLDARMCGLTESLDLLNNVSHTLRYIDISENYTTNPAKWSDWPLWQSMLRDRCDMFVNQFQPPIPDFVASHCKVVRHCLNKERNTTRDCGPRCTKTV